MIKKNIDKYGRVKSFLRIICCFVCQFCCISVYTVNANTVDHLMNNKEYNMLNKEFEQVVITSIKTTNVYKREIKITWKKLAGNYNYYIYYSEKIGGSYYTHEKSKPILNKSSCKIDDLDYDKTYFFFVEPVRLDGYYRERWGKRSETVSYRFKGTPTENPFLQGKVKKGKLILSWKYTGQVDQIQIGYAQAQSFVKENNKIKRVQNYMKISGKKKSVTINLKKFKKGYTYLFWISGVNIVNKKSYQGSISNYYYTKY